MIKKILFFGIVVFALLLPAVQAGLAPSYLPASSHYQGRNSFSETLNDGSTISGHLEFAVYTGTQADDAIVNTGYEGEADFVYAYQIFNYQESDAAITYFAVTGVNPDSVELDAIDAMEDFATTGVEPSDGYFNAEETKGIWEFNNTTLIQGAHSWFLFIYSDDDWIAGEIELQSTYDDDIPVPTAPEPATMVLLLGGTVLALKCRGRKT